jgi:hypothetical protein
MGKGKFMFGMFKNIYKHKIEFNRSQRDIKENDNINEVCPECATIYTILERFKCIDCKREMCEVCANKKEVNLISQYKRRNLKIVKDYYSGKEP